MKKLDFIVLGAQKSGTTTLFQLLSEHPGVLVPAGKELPFFNREDATAGSYETFITDHYSGDLKEKVIGKLTPHYLSDPRASERLLSLSPETRLVVILRDPVERAFSHYRMSRRRNLEKRDFADAINDMLNPQELERARALPTGRASENQTYLVWGEYGRLLRPYANKIAKGELLVLSTRDLEHDPKGTIQQLFDFLSIGMVTLPSLGKKMHQGGNKERLPIQAIARSIAPVRWLWRKVPNGSKPRILFQLEQWNVVKSTASLDEVPKETLSRLRQHFTSDAAEIQSLTGWRPDWLK